MSRYRCISCHSLYEERNGGFCVVCQLPGQLQMLARRPLAASTSGMQVASASELLKSSWGSVHSRSYPSLLLGDRALACIFGPPGAGKSTMLCDYLNGIAGPVVLLSSEEKLGPTISARLRRLGVTRRDYLVVGAATVDELASFCRRNKARALGIDSITATTLQVEQLRPLAKACACPVVLTCQVTKDLLPAGTNRLLHEVDVVVRVLDGRWQISKSRFQESGSGELRFTDGSEVHHVPITDGE